MYLRTLYLMVLNIVPICVLPNQDLCAMFERGVFFLNVKLYNQTTYVTL